MIRQAVLSAALALTLASPALAVSQGASLFAIQLSTGTADLYSDAGGGYITAYDHSEIGVGAQYWMMMTDDYALAISGGIGFFGETDEPGDLALPGDPDFEYSQSSFNVRVGGDRMVNLSDSAVLYFGPGFEFWSGKADFGTVESENVTRLSLSGRVGAIMRMGSWGLNIDVGHKLGYATAEEDGAKATWWPSSVDSRGGLVFIFGGAQ